MKKSVIIFAMLSVVIAFISCEQNSIRTASESLDVAKASTLQKEEPVDTIGTHDIMVAIAGDKFTFIPSIVDSASGSGLKINLLSTKKYQCLNSYLYFNYETYNVTEKEFKISLNRVVQPGSKYCEEGEKQISAITDIYPLSDGNNKLEVSLNGITYKGTIIKTGNSYNIVWPYSGGIKFSKLTLTK